MNNFFEQFSEERLKDMQKHVAAGMALGYADALLIRQVIDIALAAKQAKPVACKFGKNNGDGTYTPTYDYWPLPSYIVPHKDWPVTLFYDAPQPDIIEQTNPTPVGWEVCSPEWCNKHNSCQEAPRIWFESEDGTGQHYHPSVYTTPQPAHTEQVIPDGWKLVPIEPTYEMLKHYYDASLAPISKLSVTGYRSMLAAAPKPESE